MAERATPFGKYFLLERINVGGMAEVFKAKTVGVEGFEKVVAIKRILPSVAEDEEFIKMFVDEAKITSQLTHSNLAQTFDLGKIEDTYYIAMEYVPGKDLRAVFERLKRRGEHIPLNLAAYMMARVCEGLDYAHRKKDPAGRELHIVHRDVSPQNIIVSYEGEVKLIDFGIAKAAHKMSRTQAGILKGKFGYMSPEQVRGYALDGRSDIFAAGVVLYELCTGERLFTGSSDYSVLEKVQQARVTPPSQIEPAIPLRLERIILKALAKETADRYQHAGDLATELTRWLLDTQPRPPTRDDITSFMRDVFADELQQKPQRRPPPAIHEEQRKAAPRAPDTDPQAKLPVHIEAAADRLGPIDAPRRSQPPPPLPVSLARDLEEARAQDVEDLGPRTDPERTQVGPAPMAPPSGNEPKAQIIVKSKLREAIDSLPPMPVLPPLQPSAPPPLPSVEVTSPGDQPTRPMSMDELAAAERKLAQQHEQPAPFGEQEATPVQRPAQDTPTPVGSKPVSKPPPPPRRAPPKVTVEDRTPEPGTPLEEQKTALRPRPSAPPPPPPAAEPPPPAKRRWLPLAAIVASAIVVIAIIWAVLGPSKGARKPARDAGAFASLSVTTEPADAVLLLDGAQVKDARDALYTEPKLTAGVEHTLTARRAGFSDQAVSVTLDRGEQKQLTVKLQPEPTALVVLSSPPDATVYVDGERQGETPAYLPSLDATKSHAVVLEKKCYRSWQMAVPPRAGKRELAASLQPAPGACPRKALAPNEGMPTRDLPDEAQQDLGFLSLGSRPIANVVIDGVDIGQETPLLGWPLHAGSHSVRLVAGAARQELSVEIQAGETRSEVVDLSAARSRGRR